VRADWIAKARKGDDSARDGLMKLLSSDEIPYWKASAALLLERWIGEPAVQSVVTAQLQHEHPLVRQSAAHALEAMAPSGVIRSQIEPLLDDPVRSVRSTAAWALRNSLNLDSTAGKDLLHMLSLNLDQPSGQMQAGQFWFARGNHAKAIEHMEKAILWDPNSPPFHHDLAMIYSVTGQTKLAIGKMRDAIRLAPKHAEYHYDLGLALAETGDIQAVVASLEEAVRLDPLLARAWYNLGLAKNSLNDPEGAMTALLRGEAANPSDPAIPYARATILARLGRGPEAMQAVEKTLMIQRNHPEALQMKVMLMQR
jgi:tetratricopeptide (TPR) repeat protein